MATPLGVECLLVVTGPLRLLEKNPKPIEPKEVEEAIDVEPGIGKALRAFLKLDKRRAEGDEPEEHDYDETLKLVTAKRSDQEELARRTHVCQHLDQFTAGQYSVGYDRVKGFLEATLPRRQITTLTGIHTVEASPVEMSGYWRVWEAAEDPLVLLRDLTEGILVSDQVVAVQQLYPTLYAVMSQQMLMAMGEAQTKDKDWEPASWQEQQIETLLQISRLSPDLAAQLQARSRRAEQQDRAEEQGGQQGVNLQDKGIDAMQTSTQRQALR